MGINKSVKSRNVSNYGVEDTWVHAAVVNETGSGQNKTSTVNDPADWRKVILLGLPPQIQMIDM